MRITKLTEFAHFFSNSLLENNERKYNFQISKFLEKEQPYMLFDKKNLEYRIDENQRISKRCK